MVDFVLKKIFLPGEEKKKKVMIVNSEFQLIKDEPFTVTRFLVEASGVENVYSGFVLLEAYNKGNYVNFYKDFIGKRVELELYISREKYLMNKKVISSVKFKRKEYKVLNEI